MPSFVTVIEEWRKKNWKLFWVEVPWLEFNHSPPSIISILDEDINLIQTLNFEMWLAVGCNP
jgi:hypothetical protein